MYCSRNRATIPRPDNEVLFAGNVGISFCYKLLAKGQIVNFSENSTEEDHGLVTKLINLGYSYTITEEIAYYVRPQ